MRGRPVEGAASGMGGGGGKRDDPRSTVAIQSEFNRRASKIGYAIHQTSQKLAKLAKLAKRTPVFDDPAWEIQDLMALVEQEISALNSAVVDLQALCNSQNESGSFSSDTTTHSATVVDSLKNRLMHTTKKFKDVLTMLTENLKVHENRRQLFSSNASKDSTNPFIHQRPLASRSDPHGSMVLHHHHYNYYEANKQMLNLHHCCSSSTINKMVPLQDTHMQSRADALQNVESTIHELSNIFT